MSYSVEVVFSSPNDSMVYVFRDFIGEDDWTCLDYWSDLAAFIEHIISFAEDCLDKIFPDGHDYSLSHVDVLNEGDAEE